MTKPNEPIAKGWQCPACSRVMAPHVTSCERCVGCAPVMVPTPITPWPYYPGFYGPWWGINTPTITYAPVDATWSGGGPVTSSTVTVTAAERAEWISVAAFGDA